MDNELVQEILDRLDAVGEAVSEGAVAGFEVLVRQAFITGLTNTLWGVLLVAVGTVASVTLYRSYVAYRDTKLGQRSESLRWSSVYRWEHFFHSPAPYVGGVLAAICMPIGLTLLTDGIKYLVNPEYYALKEVMSIFGG